MTDLQISLIAVGAAAVAGVWGFNKFQEYRVRKAAETLLKGKQADVLLAEPATGAKRGGAAAASPRMEPSLGDDEIPLSVAPQIDLDDEVLLADEQAFSPAPLADAAFATPPGGGSALASQTMPVVPATATDEPPASLASPLIDYIAAFEMVEGVPGEQIVLVGTDLARRLGRRVACIGLPDSAPQWELCTREGSYRRLRVAVQLADRTGPITDAQLELFRDAMQQVADELLAVADMPPRRQALEAAQKLDAMCAGVDIQVGVNVVCGAQPFVGTKLRGLIESAGLVADADGGFSRCDDDGRLLFRVLNHDPAGFSPESLKTQSVRGITFLVDVPRVARGDRVFNQMVELANRFAETLGGTLVDDNRRPITEQFLSPIRTQIIQYQGVLATHTIPAGGDLALRLFS